MLPTNWPRITPIIDAALEAPPEARDAIISKASADDPELRAQLKAMLAECERDSTFLNRPVFDRFACSSKMSQHHRFPDSLAGGTEWSVKSVAAEWHACKNWTTKAIPSFDGSRIRFT